MRIDEAAGVLTVGEDQQSFFLGWCLAPAGELSITRDRDVALH
jgi:hypothetical protein